MSIAVAGKDTRFSRLEAIDWWDQALLARSRVLVIGAGALGNEVVKNLALLGVGQVVVADMDHVEESNLSRSVLFRAADEGRPKAVCAAEAALGIYPDGQVHPVVGNVLSDLGLGWFRWADVVIGALDNREARVFVNRACAAVGRPWFDGGIEVLRGIVRGFRPPTTACYECTMSRVDWELLNRRRSCSLLARRAAAHLGTPTTPTSASVIAALQVQEVVKHLHGRPALLGRGFVFDGVDHASYTVDYQISSDCPWHDPPAAVVSWRQFDSNTPMRIVWVEAERQLTGLDAIDFSRELVEFLECPACRERELALLPADNVPVERLRCARCGGERTATFFHSLTSGSPHLDRSPAELGLPDWDIVWARRGATIMGLEMTGDQRLPAREEISATI